MLSSFADGIEVAVSVILWPVFLYKILEGNLLEIGAVSTLIVAVTIVIQLLVGRYMDKVIGAKERTLKIGSGLYAIGWILKVFVISAAQVFMVGLYHNVVKIFTKTPLRTIVYDMTAEKGKLIDEFTVLREIAWQTGRVACLVVTAIATIWISVEWIFLLAAIASIALNLIYRVRPGI